MSLARTLSQKLHLSKPKEARSENIGGRPRLGRSKTTTSALHWFIQKSAFLYGRNSPTTGTQLTPEQVLDLTYMLSLPVGTPLLSTRIAGLGQPLSRSAKSAAPGDLCSVHAWFEPKYIHRLSAVFSEELGPWLDSIRKAPPRLRSAETDEMLEVLENYAPIFLPDGSGIADHGQCHLRDCSICNMTKCTACKLSSIFQNEGAVKALNMSVKGRKKKDFPWPEACAWLDPQPGSGWELKWRQEGLAVLSDRIIIRKWRKLGGHERLTEAVAKVQSETLANKREVEKGLRRLSSRKEPTSNAYDEIVERRWSVCDKTFASNENLKLFTKMEKMDMIDEEEPQADERWGEAYANLVGKAPDDSRPISHHGGGIGRTSMTDSPLSTLSIPTSPLRRSSSRSIFKYCVEDEQLGESRRVESWASSSTAVSDRTLSDDTLETPIESPDLEWSSEKEAHDQLLATLPQIQVTGLDSKIEQLDGDGRARSRGVSYANPPSRRSRAQSSFTTRSWAIFNDSPLGRAGQSPSQQSLNEQIREKTRQALLASDAKVQDPTERVRRRESSAKINSNSSRASRAQSTFSVESWEDFHDSPLNRGRPHQSKQSIGGQDGEKFPFWHTRLEETSCMYSYTAQV